MEKQRFSAQVTFDYIEEDLESQIVHLVIEKFMKNLQHRLDMTIHRKLNELIDKKIKEFAEEKMLDMIADPNKYFPSYFHKEKPESKTFHDVVMERLEQHLKHTVDWNGRDTDSYRHNEGQRIDYILKGCVNKVFHEHLGEKMNEIKTEIKDQINERVLSEIKNTVLNALATKG